MNTVTEFKQLVTKALGETSKIGENILIYIELGHSPVSIDLVTDSKIEKKEASDIYVLYDSIHKAKEMWTNEYGIVIRELVHGKKQGRQCELIKENFYPSFKLTWENGDSAEVRAGKIVSTQTDGAGLKF